MQALREISSHVDENAVKVVEALGPVLAKDDEPLQVLLRAEGLLRRGETEEAKALLEQVGPSDDPMWLQLYAGALIQAGRRKEALTHLLRASAQLPHPALLRQTAMLANSEGQPEDAERILREAIARERGDLEARELLALILTQRGAFREAAAEFEALAHLEQGGFRHQINRAISLVHAGDHAGALSLYDELCAKSDAPLVAVLGRATVLRSLGRVGEAFRGLARERGRFWSDPQFLTCLVDVGFAAGEEASAHEAFVELVRQKKEGLLPPGIIEEASLEDLKSRIAGFQKRREELGESVLGGRVPWLLVDRLLGRASYWAWGIRTQPLNWVYEQRVNLAEATVYATNGYTVVKDEESGETELRNTQCPGKGAKVVVDWTALITLHRLGLLRHAVDYFDKLFIPLTYRRHALEEGSRLVPHQLSHVRAVDAIHSLIEEQRIGVLGETNGADPEYEIDEYAEATPGRPRCSFHELFRALYELGVIPQTEVDRLSKAAPANSSQNAPLGAGKEIFVALSSLEGLSQLGVLDVVARTFHLYVDRAAIEELRSRRRVLRFQEQVRSLHGELWQFVQANPKVAELPATSAPPPASERVRNEPSIDAVRVAQTAGLPLFVDDRYCQAVVLNARSTVPDAAFGIGDFLRALQEGDSAERRLLGNAWHQLLTWRYRFLIPPSDVVLEWAAEYRGNLPGEKLRELARYAHDAVSDPGLFAGRETTTNPSTIAIRYYQDWIGTAAEVIAGVWGNTAFADSQAESFTRWMVTRLLPPPPATLPPRDQGVLLALLAKSLVGRLSIYCAPLPTSERARSAVHSAARSLGLSHEELERLIVDTIDAI